MGGIFGGGAHTTTTQQSTVENISTTDAQKHFAFNITQSGLTGDQASQLLAAVNQNNQAASFLPALGAVSGATGGFGGLVTLVVLLLFAALIFRHGGH